MLVNMTHGTSRIYLDQRVLGNSFMNFPGLESTPFWYVAEVHVKATSQPDHHLELTTSDMASVLVVQPTNRRKVSRVTVVLVASVRRTPGFWPRWKMGGTRHGSPPKMDSSLLKAKTGHTKNFWAMSLIKRNTHTTELYILHIVPVSPAFLFLHWGLGGFTSFTLFFVKQKLIIIPSPNISGT